MGDVLIEDEYKDLIRIIPVSNIEEVLEYSPCWRRKGWFL